MVHRGADENPACQFARDAFKRIQESAPALKMDVDTAPLQVELSMDIPAQPGLGFPVHLNLQNIRDVGR